MPYPPENPVVLREYDGLNWGDRYAPLPKSISGKNGINNKARYRNRENISQASVITDKHKANNDSDTRREIKYVSFSKQHEGRAEKEFTAAAEQVKANKLLRTAAQLASVIVICSALGTLSIASSLIPQDSRFSNNMERLVYEESGKESVDTARSYESDNLPKKYSDTLPENIVEELNNRNKNPYLYPEIEDHINVYLVPVGTKGVVINGDAHWLNNCNNFMHGYEERKNSYKIALQEFFNSTDNNVNNKMNKIRELAAKQRNALVDLGIIDDEIVGEPGWYTAIDSLEPVRGNWVGYAYFAYLIADESFYKNKAFTSFVTAVNAVTATLMPGGDQDKIARACSLYKGR